MFNLYSSLSMILCILSNHTAAKPMKARQNISTSTATDSHWCLVENCKKKFLSMNDIAHMWQVNRYAQMPIFYWHSRDVMHNYSHICLHTLEESICTTIKRISLLHTKTIASCLRNVRAAIRQRSLPEQLFHNYMINELNGAKTRQRNRRL